VVTPKAAAKPKQGVRPAAQPRAQRPSTELIHIDGLAWSMFIDAVTSAVQFAG
jgi:hypothetical protein